MGLWVSFIWGFLHTVQRFTFSPLAHSSRVYPLSSRSGPRHDRLVRSLVRSNFFFQNIQYPDYSKACCCKPSGIVSCKSAQINKQVPSACASILFGQGATGHGKVSHTDIRATRTERHGLLGCLGSPQPFGIPTTCQRLWFGSVRSSPLYGLLASDSYRDSLSCKRPLSQMCGGFTLPVCTGGLTV